MREFFMNERPLPDNLGDEFEEENDDSDEVSDEN